MTPFDQEAREAAEKYVKTTWKHGSRSFDKLTKYCSEDFLAGASFGRSQMLKAVLRTLRGAVAKREFAGPGVKWADWLEKRMKEK